ncbi:methylenetetrahydrofolate reductase [Aeromicrobium chenweiae]|uniref:Methylenetetrahydrofolate reductase n=1 Tax=Aeromicrobium chenweiae TaxID=2079793 RepID=A0A2S0WJH5_9ACTN|nr:methylenetetrahydrofolate reductase [Aeromicrobium chenweiae]AWB91483.1 5,10-methylenetetrahydrofolate reductase [Aeromicrobium chenweiae]TGN29967.1 5,10-methylenetetrahydrofolate reductase [Aeromicrobium chenweiae]
MRNKSTARELRRLLESSRYEVLPTASIEDKILESLPRGHTLTVTASPGKGMDATLDLAERLVGHGYQAVPHLAARMISGRAELTEIVDRLRAIGIDSVFVPAGDADPAGDYAGSLDLLQDLTAMGSPFHHVGVTGYPESHPTIADDVTVQAMWDKRHHATTLVSNLCFDPQVVRTWVQRVRSRGAVMPLLIGMPGPVERTKLLAMATKIGVSESTRFLAKNKSVFARIAMPGGFSPEKFLERIAPTTQEPASHVEGLHLFTFNQVAETEAWRQELLARLGATAHSA